MTMGMDAIAYLWYGTEPVEGYPLARGMLPQEKATLHEGLKARGALVVVIHSEGHDGYALAVPSSYRMHDWDYPDKPFHLSLPTSLEIETLQALAVEVGWPWDETKVAWHLSATIQC